CRLCRRHGQKLMLKGDKCLGKCILDRRNVPPGQQFSRRRRVSDRGLQLREKQRARLTYGVLERQFRRLFAEAEKRPGATGENLIQLLERRLDNVVYRLGFADSRAQARQLVRHGHIRLNGRRASIPSLEVKPGDVITWREASTKTVRYKALAEAPPAGPLPGWLSLDAEKLSARILGLPSMDDVEVSFDATTVVEYYSR
ncbi:MAG: 30S ribosomal protein S4, partial [Dehalococcoidia bacterium]